MSQDQPVAKNLHRDLAGSTISALSPPPCCASIYWAPALFYLSLQNKKSTCSCDGSGCPHSDDLLPLMPGLFILNLNIANRETVWSQAPLDSPESCKGDCIPGWLISHTKLLKWCPSKYQCPFQTQKATCFSDEKKVNGLWEVNVFSAFSSKNHRPSNTLPTFFCSL